MKSKTVKPQTEGTAIKLLPSFDVTATKLERKKTGARDYGPKQKAQAMVVLDYFNGNIHRTAQTLGISRLTLMKWRDELHLDDGSAEAEETKKAYTKGSIRILEPLARLVECLCVTALMKADQASMRDLYCLIGVVLDKMEKIIRLQSGEKPEKPEKPAVAAPVAEPKPAVAQVMTEEEKQKQAEREELVRLVMEEAAEANRPITRAEALLAIDAEPERDPAEIEGYSN